MKRTLFIFLAALLLASCGEGKLASNEYHVNGEWRRCELVEVHACGMTLRCGDQIYQCQINVETR